ncbi:hypothetical protein [uncultured Akkermansia sp.]|uniref:hypothetical protein n=1 Tax=uncultured Akkermansia sp. TaxID=512294 RepID=UPI0026201D18|nr:hypothetical protein [uncultured Akkermansia sp.]
MSGFSQESLDALAEAYSLQELKAKRKEVADKLLELDMITSASGGGGSSYSRQQRMDAESLLAALNMAIKAKTGQSPNPGQSVTIVGFRNTDY